MVKLSDMIGKTAMESGKWAHSFPFFGTEIRGSAVKAFTRVDDSPIHIKSYIYKPDSVIVTNDIVLNMPETTSGVNNKTRLLVNTANEKGLPDMDENCRIFAIDATKIAFDIIGRPIPNTVLFGAFIGISRLLPLESAEKIISEEFPAPIAKLNIAALHAGYDEIKRRI